MQLRGVHILHNGILVATEGYSLFEATTVNCDCRPNCPICYIIDYGIYECYPYIQLDTYFFHLYDIKNIRGSIKSETNTKVKLILKC